MKNGAAKRLSGWRRVPKGAASRLIWINSMSPDWRQPARLALNDGIAWRSPMMEQRNRVVQVSRFGDPERLQVVDAHLPIAGPGELRVRVLASSLNYTEVLIRRHLY